MEWKILDDQPLPVIPPDAGPPRPRGARRWLLLGALALLILLLGAAVTWRRAHTNEARLREDVTQAVMAEERALRFGVAEQADELANPQAPAAWQVRYRALFDGSQATLPPAEVEDVRLEQGAALVTLAYPTEAVPWQMVRAYHFDGSQWRRTPVPAEAWAPFTAYHSVHFTVWMSDRDAAVLQPDELLSFLEQFRTSFLARWSPARESRLTLRIVPDDLAPISVGSDPTSELHITSPLLAAFRPYPFLPPAREYQLALAESVAASLDGGQLRATQAEEVEGANLRQSLRRALVRHLLLSEAEQRQFRAFVQAQTRADQRPSESRWDTATLAYLHDYLIALEGLGAPSRLASAARQSVTLQAATIQAFGLPLSSLLEETRLWMETDATVASQPSEPQQGERAAQLLRVLGDNPFRALVVTGDDGALVELSSPTPPALPASCLGSGTRLSFRASEQGSALVAEAVAIMSLRLPTWPVAPLPPHTRTLIARHQSGSTRLIALDEQGGESELASLPDGIDLVIHPHEPSFAFLLQDRCGLSVNQYVMQLGRITRTPISPQGEAHLFWAEQLYLLDDASQSPTPQWTVTPLLPWELGDPVAQPVDAGMRWARMMGYSAITNQRLVELQDGSLHWLDLIRWFSERGFNVQPAHLALPVGATSRTLSTDGRWLAYTLADASGGTDLYVLDIQRNEPIWLHHLEAGAGEFGAISFGAGMPTPLLVVLHPAAASDDTLLTYQGYPTNDTVIAAGMFHVPGQVDDLHWCNNGRLLYRLTREGSPALAEGLSATLLAPGDAQVLGCVE